MGGGIVLSPAVGGAAALGGGGEGVVGCYSSFSPLFAPSWSWRVFVSIIWICGGGGGDGGFSFGNWRNETGEEAAVEEIEGWEEEGGEEGVEG